MTFAEVLAILPKETEIINGHLSDSVSLEKIVGTIPGAANGLTFVDHKRQDQQELAERSQSKVIICSKAIETTAALKEKILIKVKNPKFVFSKIGNALFLHRQAWGIHPSSTIHPEAIIHPDTYIGPNSYIGKVRIGQNTIIEGNAFLYDGVEIGAQVLVYAGSVIGSVGYGYVRDETGFPIQFPHVGKVIIEDFVEVGSNTTIDIGSLSNTVIGWGSKLDNLVHIGHNVVIGKCVYVAASTSIAGSSRIGDYCNIWTGVRIADGIRIGEGAYIGMGSVVISDVPERKKCFGNPARTIGDAPNENE
jgi:UDP-3-O-[3-hydroxymyristoyl] glucosamine N-acyltransferase